MEKVTGLITVHKVCATLAPNKVSWLSKSEASKSEISFSFSSSSPPLSPT